MAIPRSEAIPRGRGARLHLVHNRASKFAPMKKLVAVLAVGLLLSSAACTEDYPGPESQSISAGPPPLCAREMDAAFSSWAKAGFSGSVAISTGDGFDCLAAYGSANDATATPNTVDTVFSIGSITKAFTAAAVFHLVDDGKLALDDRAGKLLPELDGPVANATVEQLLLHTSGLNGTHANDTEPMGREAALKAIDGLELAARPGSRYLYSNAGYTLLALIIDKVSGSSYRDYLASHILPLPDGRVAGGYWNGKPAAPAPRALGYLESGEAGESGDFAGPFWAVEGNGGLAMTMKDLVTWTRALFTGKVVSPQSARAIATPGREISEGRAEAWGWVAYDASVYGKPFLATAGGGGDIGHNAVLVWVPEDQMVIAMAANKPKISAEKLLETVGPALALGKPLPVPTVEAGRGDMAAAAGTYELGTGGSFEVAVRDDHLAVTATGADAVTALFPPPAGISASDLRKHEEQVGALLAGKTQEGRKERAAFERQYGPMGDITLTGTIAHGDEMRTYVTIASGSKLIPGWFSLNAAGGVKAAEIPTKGAATLHFLPSGDDRYHPDDPTGVRPDVTVAFADGRMTVTGPAGSTAATRAG
ncbi:serine hydrolase domain-containing protein [Nonomuraea sp. KM90]